MNSISLNSFTLNSIEGKRENHKCCRHKNQNINICWTVGSVVSQITDKKRKKEKLTIRFI